MPTEAAPEAADFSDPQSQDVLKATARALARELGRQAYRDLMRKTRAADVEAACRWQSEAR